ncbi:MAG: 50S ribosomal protein L21e, partial [Candidatus Altiarchaeales archaeon HGW-Altiarchaeales-1]
MVYGSHGFLRRSRNTLKGKPRDRGKISIRKYFQEFAVGETAGISIDVKYRNIP